MLLAYANSLSHYNDYFGFTKLVLLSGTTDREQYTTFSDYSL
jgi:hypothetical protein